jgi:hypothetical protein
MAFKNYRQFWLRPPIALLSSLKRDGNEIDWQVFQFIAVGFSQRLNGNLLIGFSLKFYAMYFKHDFPAW